MRRSSNGGVHICCLEDRCVPAIFLVDTNGDLPDANLGDGLARDMNGKTSLRAAVQEANALAEANGFDASHIIEFNQAMTVTLTSPMDPFIADIAVNNVVPVVGTDEDPPPPPPQVVIEGDGTFRLFEIDAQSDSSFSGPFKITDGNAANADGGAFRNDGWLTLSSCEIVGNTAERGGAIATGTSGGAYLNINACQIYGNTATKDGGGLYCGGDTLIDYGTEIYGNTAQRDGGGICVAPSASVTIWNSLIYGNTATEDGGGVLIAGTFEMHNGSLLFNAATGHQVGGQLKGGLGGGLCNRKPLLGDGGTVSLTGVTIQSNQAGAKGGAMHLYAQTGTTLTDCTMMQSTAAMLGPGICMQPTAELQINGGTNEDGDPVFD